MTKCRITAYTIILVQFSSISHKIFQEQFVYARKMLFLFYSYLTNYKIHFLQILELQTLDLFGKLLFRGDWKFGELRKGRIGRLQKQFIILRIMGESFRGNAHISLKIKLKKTRSALSGINKIQLIFSGSLNKLPKTIHILYYITGSQKIDEHQNIPHNSSFHKAIFGISVQGDWFSCYTCLPSFSLPSHIPNAVRHLRWRFLRRKLVFFAICSLLDFLQCFEYGFALV